MESGQRAPLEERQRTACELDDVVAELMSVIVIQAEAATTRTPIRRWSWWRSFGDLAQRAGGLSESPASWARRAPAGKDRPEPGWRPGRLVDSACSGGVSVTVTEWEAGGRLMA